MNKIWILLLIFVFLLAVILPEPNFIFENFWSKADFWDMLFFTPSFWLFKLVYAIAVTGLVELVIRFIKKYI